MTFRRIFVNALTFARLPLILAWMVFAIVAEIRDSWIIALVGGLFMALSGISDLFDGYLARKWNVVSKLGQMADPLMDKVFYLCAFPTLVWQITRQAESPLHAIVMLVFTVLYLLRDTWVTFLRAVGSAHGANVSAMWLGKVRTALSFPGAGFVYAYLALHRLLGIEWWDWWLYACFAFEALLIALTLWSLVTYTIAYAPYLRMAVRGDKSS